MIALKSTSLHIRYSKARIILQKAKAGNFVYRGHTYKFQKLRYVDTHTKEKNLSSCGRGISSLSIHAEKEILSRRLGIFTKTGSDFSSCLFFPPIFGTAQVNSLFLRRSWRIGRSIDGPGQNAQSLWGPIDGWSKISGFVVAAIHGGHSLKANSRGKGKMQSTVGWTNNNFVGICKNIVA